MKKIIIIVGVALLLLAGGGAAALLLMGKGAPPDTTDGAAAEVAAEEEAEEDPIYLALNPAFVVNFEHMGSIRYLQLSMQIMAYEQAVVDKVQANMPAVRNNLILLFSGQDYDALNTLEGKEQLRRDVLASVNEVVRARGDQRVSDVFFTGFVVQ